MKTVKHNTLFSVFIIFVVLLICSNGFSYVDWNPTFGGQIMQLLLILLLFYTVIIRKFVMPVSSHLKYFMLAFMLTPLLSMLPAYIIHNQSFLDSFYYTKLNFYYAFFFLLYYLKIEEKVVLHIFLFLGIAWCCVEIIQQFTYPSVWFATRTETDERLLEIRYGIYRYNTCGREFGIIMLFYCFVNYLEERKTKYLIGVILGLIGIYILVTRQIIISILLCLCYGLFATKRINVISFVLTLLMAVVIYIYGDDLFEEIFEQISSDLNNKDYVRFLSYTFYGLTYNKGQILPILLGNGDIGRNSSYANEIHDMQSLGLWRADIGVVGTYSVYGLIYVLIIVLFFAYCFHKRKQINLYLKMYILFMLCTSIMLWHFTCSAERITIMCCIFYLIDRSISRKEFNISMKNKVMPVLKV